jgi:protein SCO1/2
MHESERPAVLEDARRREHVGRSRRLALVEAGKGGLGSVVDRALLLCYHYEAENGRYTPIILGALRWFGGATVLGLGGLVWLLWRADRRRQREHPAGGA